MGRFHYFAYGSNLLTSRLQARCASTRVVGNGGCAGYCTKFNKLSHRDGSAKAALHPTPCSNTHGVVFEIDLAEREALDHHEGLGKGYDRTDDLEVRLADGSTLKTTCYLGTEPHEGLRPFDWYLALVLAGAKEHSLAANHIAMLAATHYQPDPDPERKTRTAAIAALNHSGHSDWHSLLPETC